MIIINDPITINYVVRIQIVQGVATYVTTYYVNYICMYTECAYVLLYCIIHIYVATYACVHACVYSTHNVFIVKINYKTFSRFFDSKFRPVSEVCVTSFDISWDVSNNIKCGDVSYEVSISPPPIEVDAVATTDNRSYNVAGLNSSRPNVTITVTARDRAGRGNNRKVFVELPKPLGKYYTLGWTKYYMYSETSLMGPPSGPK